MAGDGVRGTAYIAHLDKTYDMGLFINYIIQLEGMGSVSQKMAKNDKGGGGGLAKDDR